VKPRSRAADPGQVWRGLVNLMMELRGDWRRAISSATGLPFGRWRVLRHLTDGPRTLRELAQVLGSDAPATTVTVNDLEHRGLVVRTPHPTNRRAKLVSLTAEGHAIVVRGRRVMERPPTAFTTIAPSDLAALARVVDVLSEPTAQS
jgi:DNA-binding MarR family transcriptional regulator